LFGSSGALHDPGVSRLSRSVVRRGLVVLAVGEIATLEGCYLTHERVEEAACVEAPVESCRVWEAAGEAIAISEPAGAASLVQLADALALDCEVLVSWNVGTSVPGALEVQTFTRVIGFDARSLGVTERHPTLTHGAPTWSGLQLARSGERVGGLAEIDGRCVVLPMDTRGVERGPAVELERDAACRGLEATDARWSFVRSAMDGGGVRELVTFDADGGELARAPLAVSGRTWWSRARFEDGSFLSYSFSQDLTTLTYSGFLQRFDEDEAPRGEEVSLGDNGVPVHVAETSRGALATWTTAASGGQPVRLRPIDRDGRARAETRSVPAEGALYGLTIRSTPDGGAVLAWEEWHFEGDAFRLRLQSLDADGMPLGEPTVVRDVGHARRLGDRDRRERHARARRAQAGTRACSRRCPCAARSDETRAA
jgi:hypothetical protein